MLIDAKTLSIIFINFPLNGPVQVFSWIEPTKKWTQIQYSWNMNVLISNHGPHNSAITIFQLKSGDYTGNYLLLESQKLN